MVEIGSLVISIISVFLAIFFYLKTRRIQRLDVAIGKPLSIVKAAPLTSKNNKLKVAYDGKEVNNLSMLRITAASTGNTPIRKEDLKEKPLCIVIPHDDAEILECSVEIGEDIVSIPEGLTTPTRIQELRTESLNPGDSFQLALLINGIPDDQVELRGKVIGGNEKSIRVVKSLENEFFRNVRDLFVRGVIISLPLVMALYWLIGVAFQSMFKYYGAGLRLVNIIASVVIGLLSGAIVVTFYWAKRKRKSFIHSSDR